MCVLELERDGDIVKLTQDNAEKVDAMIKENSSYALTLNDEALCPESKFLEYLKDFVKSAEAKDEKVLIDKKNADAFCGSTKWWVEQLSECKDEKSEEYFKVLIAGLIHNIDRTNSTHLNARTKDEETGETQGRKQIYKTITENINNIKTLKLKLKDEDKPLIGRIAKKDDKTGKFNLSFATKFCHYLTWYLNQIENENKTENKTEKETIDPDMYSIYDSVIVENLQSYINYYVKSKDDNDEIENIKKKNFPNNRQKIENFLKNPSFKKKARNEDEMENEIIEFYKTYMDIIDRIIKGKGITRRQFDHLVWYSNKGKKSTESQEDFDKYLSQLKKDLIKK